MRKELLVREAWSRVLQDPRCTRQMRRAQLPKSPRLLGSSTKIEKGLSRGVLSSVLYLSPSTESGRDVCPWATAGCAAACLGHSSGRMVFNASRNARIWKTGLFLYARPAFEDLLLGEIVAHSWKATRAGLVPAVRLNGTSDIVPAWDYALTFPQVRFYDYTKNFRRAMDFAQGGYPPNYHVTFSRSGTERNHHQALEILYAGGNVAVVFDCKAPDFPDSWLGFPVLDGDASDVRFYDPPGHVVGLSFKGSRRAEAGNFVWRTRGA